MRGSRGSPKLSQARRFLFEPVEPRVLLSADPVVADIYGSLLRDETEFQSAELAVIVQEMDAATSAEIAINWDGVGPGGPAAGDPGSMPTGATDDSDPNDEIRTGETPTGSMPIGPEATQHEPMPTGDEPLPSGDGSFPTGGGSFPSGDGWAAPQWDGIGPGGPTAGDLGSMPTGPTDDADRNDSIHTGETPTGIMPLVSSAPGSELSPSITRDDSAPIATASGGTMDAAVFALDGWIRLEPTDVQVFAPQTAWSPEPVARFESAVGQFATPSTADALGGPVFDLYSSSDFKFGLLHTPSASPQGALNIGQSFKEFTVKVNDSRFTVRLPLSLLGRTA